MLTAVASSTTPTTAPDPVTRPLTCLSSCTFARRSSQAQQRRMEWAAGKCERKRIRKQLAQPITSNPLASET